ncbi:hypothetical protein IE81DRAFT_113863 [Ceraceosorus guamensis]|uniref:Uncharacterized protein n=1 Tax=Ceraceosorus guamensis TaxID=1522189 RepID=A0A316VZ89_9BASI|nr:hypothetical protein IE81DRAFT_113863 [Ceraceosorus guamensis]PWN42749.1 hypothetical protein IE81DRAFT_113863 [Ceraceosorus guamensis]
MLSGCRNRALCVELLRQSYRATRTRADATEPEHCSVDPTLLVRWDPLTELLRASSSLLRPTTWVVRCGRYYPSFHTCLGIRSRSGHRVNRTSCANPTRTALQQRCGWSASEMSQLGQLSSNAAGTSCVAAILYLSIAYFVQGQCYCQHRMLHRSALLGAAVAESQAGLGMPPFMPLLFCAAS